MNFDCYLFSSAVVVRLSYWTHRRPSCQPATKELNSLKSARYNNSQSLLLSFIVVFSKFLSLGDRHRAQLTIENAGHCSLANCLFNSNRWSTCSYCKLFQRYKLERLPSCSKSIFPLSCLRCSFVNLIHAPLISNFSKLLLLLLFFVENHTVYYRVHVMT